MQLKIWIETIHNFAKKVYVEGDKRNDCIIFQLRMKVKHDFQFDDGTVTSYSFLCRRHNVLWIQRCLKYRLLLTSPSGQRCGLHSCFKARQAAPVNDQRYNLVITHEKRTITKNKANLKPDIIKSSSPGL